MSVYDVIITYNKKTGKTSFGLMKDRKDNLNPDAEELKIYFSALKLVMDKVGLKLKAQLASASEQSDGK